MNSQNFPDHIRDLIAHNDLPAALQQLRVLLENSPLLDEAILQMARFEDIRKQIRLGMLSDKEANFTKDQIREDLLDLLKVVETEAKKPAQKAEMDAAVSVMNSKNVVIGSTISAGGNVHIGDKTTNINSPSPISPPGMKEQRKTIWLSILIAAFGILIGFLGELMPDAFKEKVAIWSTAAFGISYIRIWVIVTALIVLFFLWLIWREALKDNSSETSQAGTIRKVKQGDKSIYIEDNNGPINIQ